MFKKLLAVVGGLAVVLPTFFVSVERAEALACSDDSGDLMHQINYSDSNCSSAYADWTSCYAPGEKRESYGCETHPDGGTFWRERVGGCTYSWTCPDSTWTGSEWCSGSVKYRSYITYSCGTSGACNSTTTSEVIGTCTVTVPVNGVCGSSDGQSFTTAPTTNLCSAGNPSVVSGSGPWTWDCVGIDGGSTDSCSADLTYVYTYLDIGFKIYDGSQVITIAIEQPGEVNSPLRIAKNETVYEVALVDVGDANASKIRVKTASGIKALRRL